MTDGQACSGLEHRQDRWAVAGQARGGWREGERERELREECLPPRPGPLIISAHFPQRVLDIIGSDGIRASLLPDTPVWLHYRVFCK